MSTKLVRTQICLDPQIVKRVKKRLKKLKKKTSLAQYIRDLMLENLDKENQIIQKRTQTLLSKAGVIQSLGDGMEAKNHNDIYKI